MLMGIHIDVYLHCIVVVYLYGFVYFTLILICTGLHCAHMCF